MLARSPSASESVRPPRAARKSSRTRAPGGRRPPVIDIKERGVPVNTRQSGDGESRMLISTRVRKSPYWHLSQQEGCWAYTVYNHMYHPRAYISMTQGGLMREYEYLTRHVTMWNVAVERQIQVKGPDAAAFVNLLITRDVHEKLPTNMCRYVILCNREGGIVNDPVLLRVADDEFWFSISDSDVLLWAQGVNAFSGHDVTIREIDVAPVQIQGPKSVRLMTGLFGRKVLDIPYYGLMHARLGQLSVVVSRTGFSGEVGYEIYLRDATRHADELWHAVKKAGERHNLRVIAPSHIRRLEAGILSYGQDMDIETNPFEVGLGWQVDFSKDDFIGKAALQKIRKAGVKQKLVGLRMGGSPIVWYNEDFWHVINRSGREVGYITSAFWSPTHGTNIALATLPVAYARVGAKLKAALPAEDAPVDAEVVPLPFKDPNKEIPKQAVR